MSRGIKRGLEATSKRINDQLKALSGNHSGPGPNYAAGLATEGFVGGYGDAVSDVKLALSNVKPRDRFGFWSDFTERPRDVRTRGIKRDLKLVLARIEAKIKALSAGHRGPGPNYAAGLASEGYVGGYREAIYDVRLAMSGIKPNDRYGFWQDFTGDP